MNNNETITRAKEIIELQSERTSLKTMADYVKEYIIAYCDEDPGFVECVNNVEKSFMSCIGYIKKKALEWLKEQQNLEISAYTQGIGGEVPPDICYQWAIEYYYSKPEPKPEPKKVESAGSSKTKGSKKNAAKATAKEETASPQMSLADCLDTKTAKDVEEISLFDSKSDEESPDDEDEGDEDCIFGEVEVLTEEEIAELPFGKEVA